MQRMWRKLFATLTAVLVVAGVTSAQAPPPKPFPPVITVSAQTPPVTDSVAPVSGSYAAEGGAKAVARAPIPFAAYGPGQLNGCGGLKSDLGFIFGTCKSFFDPCGPIPCGANGSRLGGRFSGKHMIHPFGSPYNVGCTGCSYDSFLNR